MSQYVVTAPCLVHVPFDTPQGRQLGTLYAGSILPDSVPQKKIDFWLEAGMIKPVEVRAEPAQEVSEESGAAAAAVSQGPGPEQGPGAPPTSGAGSGKEAWVDYAVRQGMDRDEAAGMSRDELIRALKPAEPSE